MNRLRKQTGPSMRIAGVLHLVVEGGRQESIEVERALILYRHLQEEIDVETPGQPQMVVVQWC